MKRLFSAIWILGPRLGWRYWKIENRCIKDPSLVKKWAEDCRIEAAKFFTDSNDGEDPRYFILQDWADMLEYSYANHIDAPQPPPAEGPQCATPVVEKE